MKTFKIVKEINEKEHPWLVNKEYPVGTIVYEFMGYDYGCNSGTGPNVSKLPNETHFTEMPYEYIELV